MKLKLFIAVSLVWMLSGCSQAYKEARKTDTIESYNEYLKLHSGDEAKDSWVQSRILKLEYEEADSADTKTAFQDFIKQNDCESLLPSATAKCETYKKKAKKKIERFERAEHKEAYLKAKDIDTIEAYSGYLNRFNISIAECKKDEALCREHNNRFVLYSWARVLRIEKEKKAALLRQQAEEKKKTGLPKLKRGKAKYSDFIFEENSFLSENLLPNLHIGSDVKEISQITGYNIKLSKCKEKEHKGYQCIQPEVANKMTGSSPARFFYFKDNKLVKMKGITAHGRPSISRFTLDNIIRNSGKEGYIERSDNRKDNISKMLYLVHDSGMNFQVINHATSAFGMTFTTVTVEWIKDKNRKIKW